MRQSINDRQNVIEQLAERILSVTLSHPVRVAIDGIDAAGKTSLADELANSVGDSGRQVIRASVDSFHNPRDVRYEKGDISPEGYYLNSFNNDALIRELLIPLGPGGNRQYRNSVFDYRTNEPVSGKTQTAAVDALMLVDGIFLLRPELIEYWDFSIFVDVDFPTAAARAIKRYQTGPGRQMAVDSLRRRYDERYFPGQMIYFEDADPKNKADIIFDNNVISQPKISVN